MIVPAFSSVAVTCQPSAARLFAVRSSAASRLRPRKSAAPRYIVPLRKLPSLTKLDRHCPPADVSSVFGAAASFMIAAGGGGGLGGAASSVTTVVARRLGSSTLSGAAAGPAAGGTASTFRGAGGGVGTASLLAGAMPIMILHSFSRTHSSGTFLAAPWDRLSSILTLPPSSGFTVTLSGVSRPPSPSDGSTAVIRP